MHIAGSDGSRRDFTVLPAQDIRIGRSTVRQVSFVTSAGQSKVKLEVDGMLPTGLFRRIYISYTDGFMVLEGW
jgi:hypothetical protein